MHRIAITNVTGGRNRGVDALVQSILFGLETALRREDLRISLHTGDADHDRDYFGHSVDAIVGPFALPRGHWPPRAQQATFGLAAAANRVGMSRMLPKSWRDLLASDLIIATGGDVFTSDYRALAHHSRFLQASRPVALLAQTIGPFVTKDEAHFKGSIGNVVICTVRETETLQYLNSIAPTLKPELTADVAFLLPVIPKEEAQRILEVDHRFPLQGRRLIGLSVSGGILSYRSDVDSRNYLEEIVAFMDALNRKGYSVVLIPHVQERGLKNNDLVICREVHRRSSNPSENVLLSFPLTASDFKGVIGLCDALVGARTHATIASMSQGIPTVAMAYSRKAWGIMRDYYGRDLASLLTIDVAELNRERLMAGLEAAIAAGCTKSKAAEMKRRAAVNFDRVSAFLKQQAAI
jgi:colanic acid/amylovoran biosynthesis protein